MSNIKDMKKFKPKELKDKMGVVNVIMLVVLLLYSISIIYLLLWGVQTSLKSPNDFRINSMGLPKKFMWENYTTVINNWRVTPMRTNLSIGLDKQLVYTLLYTFGGAFVQTTCFCLMAYLVAKYDYKFSKIVYVVVLITMVMPIIGSTPANLDLLKSINLYDNYLGAYIMKFNFLGMYFLVFYGSFKSLSNEFIEAATIDGANEWQVMLKIMIPLVMPTYSTIFLIKFIEFWNDYNTPLLYMPTHPTLSYGVYAMSRLTSGKMSRTPARIASCMILALPVLLIFVLFRNKIMGNVTMGGVKE